MQVSKRSLHLLRTGILSGFTFCLAAAIFGQLPKANAASSIPSKGKAGKIIESARYTSHTAARAAWIPMQDVAPVTISTFQNEPSLRFDCNFTGTRIERASWDRQIALDLSGCSGVEFSFYSPDTSPVSHFSFFFQSGNGWYHAAFFPESTNEWNTIRLEKSKFDAEGTPAGWGQIKAIRLSAWRGSDQNTHFYLRQIRQVGALGEDSWIAILKANADKSTQESRTINQYTDFMVQSFKAMNIGCTVLDDVKLTANQLKPARIVILPYNPQISSETVAALREYLQNGGKLMAFYLAPEPLHPWLGVHQLRHVKENRPGEFAAIHLTGDALPGAPRAVSQRSWNIQSAKPLPQVGQVFAHWVNNDGKPTEHPAIIGTTNGLFMTHVLLSDDAEKKRQLLLSMTGFLSPEIMQEAAENQWNQIGVFGKFTQFKEAVAAIAKGKNTLISTVLKEAQSSRKAAAQLLSEHRFAESIRKSAESRLSLQKAWCLSQTSEPGEFRAFWCHSAFGVDGMNWDEAIRRLADAGFNAIIPNMLWGGLAYYPSQVLPISDSVKERGDQIAECLKACRKYGVQIHVWKVNYNCSHRSPPEFISKLRQEQRLQVDLRGKEETWLCPSHPANQQLEIDSMLEVAQLYDVDGIHFDYIRYPDGDHCFCAGCKSRFAALVKANAIDWPKDVLAGGRHRTAWLDWRRSMITQVVKTVSEKANAFKPKLKISAAVFPNWNRDRDSVGQDWKLWCEKGWLDFACPMDYTHMNRQFEHMVASQTEWAGQTPFYPGIGESASTSGRMSVEKVIEQIQITRKYHTKGFVIFNYAVPEARELLPLLGSGITDKTQTNKP